MTDAGKAPLSTSFHLALGCVLTLMVSLSQRGLAVSGRLLRTSDRPPGPTAAFSKARSCLCLGCSVRKPGALGGYVAARPHLSWGGGPAAQAASEAPHVCCGVSESSARGDHLMRRQEDGFQVPPLRRVHSRCPPSLHFTMERRRLSSEGRMPRLSELDLCAAACGAGLPTSLSSFLPSSKERDCKDEMG